MPYYRTIGDSPFLYNHILINNDENNYEDALEFTEHNNNARMLLERLFGSREHFERSYKNRYAGIKTFKPAWDFVEMNRELTSRKVKANNKMKRKFQIPALAPLPSTDGQSLSLSEDSPFRHALRILTKGIPSSDSPFWDEPNFIYIFVKAFENLIVASATFLISIPFTLLENILSFSLPSSTKEDLSSLDLVSSRLPRTISPLDHEPDDTTKYETFQPVYHDLPPPKPTVKAIASKEFKRKIKRPRNRSSTTLRIGEYSAPRVTSAPQEKSYNLKQYKKEEKGIVSNKEPELKIIGKRKQASKTVAEGTSKEVDGKGGKVVPKEGGDGAFLTLKEREKTKNEPVELPESTSNNPKHSIRDTSQATQTSLDDKGWAVSFTPALVHRKPSRIIKITDEFGEPIHLFNSQGYPLCDECGCLLEDPEGKFLVVCDPENYPICCRNGDSIYLRNGTSWLAHKESSSVHAIVINEIPRGSQLSVTTGEVEKKHSPNTKKTPKVPHTIRPTPFTSRTERKFDFMHCDMKQEEIQLQEFFPELPVHKLFSKIGKIEADLKSLSEESIAEQEMIQFKEKKTVFHRRRKSPKEIEAPHERHYRTLGKSPAPLHRKEAPLVISYKNNNFIVDEDMDSEYSINIQPQKQEKETGRKWLRRKRKHPAQPTVTYENTQDDLQELYERLKADLDISTTPEVFPMIQPSPSLTPGEYLRRCINEYTKNNKGQEKKKSEVERRFNRLKRKIVE